MVGQEPEAGAPSIERSSVASEIEERPVAWWSSEETFTTGHGTSDEREGYKEQFTFPMWLRPEPPDCEESQRPPSAKAENHPWKAKPAKRKPKKKKLRAPELDGESPSKPRGKNAGREYTAGEWEYALSRIKLFKKLEQNPILSSSRKS
ncbi:LOW QUALITY PROTEIN: Eukaryotic/viral aspartic protease [Phytophthora megakarya]|uniref:Eukaryotic/viral aspartic protease n=1 Tax=Phytophthora megakarya TaxID=4795 RepID=A0A225WMU3_9STRA|nr:LOW QUALITY PROTEIN: Eukaryotic/viral aspartic protease [Phytophthora megakarya]